MNFAKILRELAKAAKPTPAQLQHAEALLRRAGYKIERPTTEPYTWSGGKITPQRQPSPFTRRAPAEGQTTGLPLPGWEGRPEPAAQGRDRSQDDLLQGTMTSVQSSNVHSIGMRIDKPGDTKGQLFVRFLAQHEGGARVGPGSLYGYNDVPVALFRRFQIAASKGGFVWDELRVRGTIAGHRYAYQLLGVVGQFMGGRHIENYVPRQAAVRRGQSGEHYIPRTFGVTGLGTRGVSGMHRIGTRQVRSQLSPGVASMRGPNPDRGPGPDALRFR